MHKCLLQMTLKGIKMSTISRLLLAFSLLIPLLAPGQAAVDEAYGVVTSIVDGDTFDVTMEKSDPRIVSGVERIRLADVDSPEMDTTPGAAAKDFTFAVLMNKRVYLDIDDLSGTGRDPYGRLICLVYLTGIYGQALEQPSFNRMLLDSGHAALQNSTNNEFDPQDWRSEGGSGTIAGELENQLQDLLSQLQQDAGIELDRRAEDAMDWLRGQISIRG